jgi:hypothetical protein
LGFPPGKAVKINCELMQKSLTLEAVLGIVARVHYFVEKKFKKPKKKMSRKSGHLKSVGLHEWQGIGKKIHLPDSTASIPEYHCKNATQLILTSGS